MSTPSNYPLRQLVTIVLGAAAVYGCDRAPPQPETTGEAEGTINTSIRSTVRQDDQAANAVEDKSPSPETAAAANFHVTAGNSPTMAASPDSRGGEPSIDHLPPMTRRQIERTREAYREAPGSSDIPARLGMMYLTNDMEKEAIPLFETAVQRGPRHADNWYLLGIALSAQQRYSEAITAYRKCIEIEPDSVFPRMRLATLLMQSNRQEAIVEFSATARLKTVSPYTLVQIAEALDGLNVIDDAIAVCRNALRLAPNCNFARKVLGNLLKKKAGGPIEETAETSLATADYGCDPPLDKVLVMATALGRPVEAGISKAMAHAALGEFENALKLLNSLLREDPRDLNIVLAQARVNQSRGFTDQAIDKYKEVLRAEKGNVQAASELGQILIKAKRYSDAVAVISPALAVHPDASELIQLQARCLAFTNRIDDAKTLYRRWIELEQGSPFARLRFARTLADLRLFDEAISEIEPLLQDSQFRTAALALRGKVMAGQGDAAGAERDWRAAMTAQPSSIEAITLLALMKQEQKEYKEAIAVLREGLSKNEGEPGIMNALGWMLATCPDPRLRNAREARELATLACGQVHFSSHAYLDTLAAACADAGDFAQADRAARMAIDLANRSGEKESVAVYTARLALYQANKPYHLPK